MINSSVVVVIILVIVSTLCNTSRYVCDKNTVPCGCGRAPVDINTRIVNGEDAIPSSWAMMVSLQDRYGYGIHSCGGTILSESYILTAAHCVDDLPSDVSFLNFTIAAGIHNLSQAEQIIRQVDKIIIYPLWDKDGSDVQYDIAILHLAKPLDLETNSSITRTCLPPRLNTSEEVMQYPLNGTSLIVIGWGQLGTLGNSPDILQQVTVNSIHNRQKICASTAYNPFIQFCAGLHEGGKGACYGDSGGPILQWIGNRWEQVGIVSYGRMGCAMKGYPAVFTRISYFHDWIESHIYNNNRTTISTNKTTNRRAFFDCDKYSTECECGRRDVFLSPSEIVRTEDALPYSWSMIVSIRVGISSQHICSGTILSSSFILTAAHCVSNRLLQDITIKAGIHYQSETDAIIRQVDHMYIHPNYTVKSNMYINDIAILHLSQPLDIENDTYISRACRHSTSDNLIDEIENSSNNTSLVIIGWNILSMSNFSKSDSLEQAEVYAINNETANCFVSDGQLQFCAGRHGSDQEICYGGDSGSPIFEWDKDNWIQVGLASYCELSAGLGVFTKLATYSDWIESILNPDSIKPVRVYPCDKKASCGCGQTDVTLTSSRIMGSENAIPHSWPMMVSVQHDNQHVCGGSILSDSFILTSAQCLYYFDDYDYLNFTITAGIHRLSDTAIVKRKIDRVYLHPNYTWRLGSLHDVAIAHLDHPLPFDHLPSAFAKTCVPMKSEVPASQYLESNTQLVVIGYGALTLVSRPSNTLRQIYVRVLNSNDESCSASMINDAYQFCAQSSNVGKNANRGYLTQDQSGGPVLIYKNNHWEQVGIVPSRGIYNFFPGRTELFTRLSPYLEWIKYVTNSSLSTYSPSTDWMENVTNSSLPTSSSSDNTRSTTDQQRNTLIIATLSLLIVIFL